MPFLPRTLSSSVQIAAATLLLVACGSVRLDTPAPVEDRGHGKAQPLPVAVEAVPVRVLPGAENAGKPGYYSVKAGDTLIHIGLDTGQSWRDIARWNNLERPDRIEVGQVLRVAPPQVVAVAAPVETAVVTRPVTTASVAPVNPAPVTSTPRPASAPVAPVAPVVATVASSPAPVPSVAPVASAALGDDNLAWAWPSNGPVLRAFDVPNNNGVDLGGSLGTPVLAAMDGRVVYVGSVVRGMGNLVIIKHNNTYVSAYAHNQTILVREEQNVFKGQKIAEMGSSDTDRVKLHFEIRRMGKPVDPLKYLPAR